MFDFQNSSPNHGGQGSEIVWSGSVQPDGSMVSQPILQGLDGQPINPQPLFSVQDWTTQPITQPVKLATLIAVPASMVNPMHPHFTPDQRRILLHIAHEDQLQKDARAMDCGLFEELEVGQTERKFTFRGGRTEAAFKGVIFEAALVRWMMENPAVGRNIYSWTIESRRTVQMRTYEKYVPIACGQRSLLMDVCTAQFYSPVGIADIQFLKIQPGKAYAEVATITGTMTPAHIQVKAITTREMEEIILPILAGKYQRVITFLNNSNGLHSHEVCMRILRSMLIAGKINEEQYAVAVPKIARPETFGIDQNDVDRYSQYISDVYWRNAATAGSPDIEESTVGDSKADYRKKILVPKSFSGIQGI